MFISPYQTPNWDQAVEAAKSITYVEIDASDSAATVEQVEDAPATAGAGAEQEEEAKEIVKGKDGVELESKNDIILNSALGRLEKASEDTLLGHMDTLNFNFHCLPDGIP